MKKLWKKFNNLQKGVKAGIISGVVIIFLIVLSTCSSDAEAIEPGWYSPTDGSGQGVFIGCNNTGGCAASWFTYRNIQLQDRLPAVDELITVVETSTAVQDATDPEPVLQALQDIRESTVPEQIWLISNELCPIEADECPLSMSRATGSWMGLFGENTLLDPEVNVVLTRKDEGIEVDFEAVQLFPERCSTGPGGLIFRECVGDKLFEVLAR